MALNRKFFSLWGQRQRFLTLLPIRFNRRLSLRYRILLVIIAALTTLLVLLYTISSTILLHGIQKAEDQSTYQITEGVQQSFQQTVQDFGDRFSDWSAWDDTYDFIQSNSASYIDSNLTAEALASLRVNLVMYWNIEGQVVYETGFDLTQKRKIAVDDPMRKHLYASSPLLRSRDRQTALTGVILLPQGPMLLTSQPILTSRGTGPLRGTLIFGRYLNMGKLQQTAHHHVNVYQAGDVQLPPDFVALQSRLATASIQVQSLNEQTIGGYLLLRDLYDQPALMVRVDVPRDIYQQGQENLENLLISLLIVGVVFGLTAQILVEKLVLFQHKRRESELRYRAVVTQAAEGIFLLDAQTKAFLEANQALQILLGYDLKELLKLTLYDVTVGDRESIDDSLQQLLADHQNKISEQNYRCCDGSIIHVEVNANQIFYGNQTVLSLVVRDVTDRKQAEIILKTQAQKEQALNRVVQAIRNSLDLTTIFATAVAEIGNALQVERVSMAEYVPTESLWRIIAEYRQTPELVIGLGLEIADQGGFVSQHIKRGEMVCIDNASQHEDPIVQSLAVTFPGSWLIMPLSNVLANSASAFASPVWGSLNLLRHQQPVGWQDWEVELACAIADQLAIALHQSQLYQQVQCLNTDLETQVTDRTAQLKQALSYESTLKRITDKVRDSLDEAQILQTAVQELAQSLAVPCCDAALYDLDQQTSTISYEYVTPEIPAGIGLTIAFADYAEIYHHLLQGQYVQCCFTLDRTVMARGCQPKYAILACPLMDDQSVIGDMYLLKPLDASFSDLEIRLVQQVANQCAIALRQVRLYQAAQTQVQELERLNRLKDDFLSTVSHELRTPMASIKMAIQMLEVALKGSGLDGQLALVNGSAEMPVRLTTPQIAKFSRYFKILQDECQREIGLINDLLDLSRLDAGAEILVPSAIDLSDWLPHLVDPFIDRAKQHDQTLKLTIAPDLPVLTTDVAKLERILTELLNNACKYTPAHEYIEMIVTPTDQETLEFTAKNSGVTIPTDELARMFDKFYRIPHRDPWKHSGTGLGLALVQKLVVHLGGTIVVHCVSHTICFTVELPLQPNRSANAA
jgi:PAS domain S-box-containing protein